MTYNLSTSTLSKSTQNGGSTESLIILLTKRVFELNLHLKSHRKDYSSLRGLKKILGQRKRLLNYLYNNDLEKYKYIIELIKK